MNDRYKIVYEYIKKIDTDFNLETDNFYEAKLLFKKLNENEFLILSEFLGRII